jgi:hypothetical protein
MTLATASAAAPPTGTPSQDHYFWWFGEAGVTTYPAFQLAPMGDDAVIAYGITSTGAFSITFGPMTYGGIQGWFEDISVPDTDWELDPASHIGTLTYETVPTAPTMLNFPKADIYLVVGKHIPLDNLWFEIDGPIQ